MSLSAQLVLTLRPQTSPMLACYSPCPSLGAPGHTLHLDLSLDSQNPMEMRK